MYVFVCVFVFVCVCTCAISFPTPTSIKYLTKRGFPPPPPPPRGRAQPFRECRGHTFFSLLRPSKIHRKQTGGKVCCCTPPSSSGSCAMFVIGSVNIYPRKKNPQRRLSCVDPPPSSILSIWWWCLDSTSTHKLTASNTSARGNRDQLPEESFTTQGGKNSQFDPCPRLRKKGTDFLGVEVWRKDNTASESGL